MINYRLIHKAIEVYTSLDYQYTETPWVVPEEVCDVTCPIDGTNITLSTGGCLVASGEQSFLSQIINGNLEPGKYVTCTPCFREEKHHDLYTLPYFLKVELIHFKLRPLKSEDVRHVLHDAFHFMSAQAGKTLNIVPTDQGHDIYYNDLEVGSYGIRTYNGYSWVYGTGLAEPRFSTIAGIRP